MPKLISRVAGALAGDIELPGDKSISHRALMIGAVALGETLIHGLSEGADVLATAAALGALGVEIERGKKGKPWRIQGRGVGGLVAPEDVLDMGNSGTGARLLMGLLASHAFTVFMTGDASLRGRPMGRVGEPLSRMGAHILASDGDRLPLALVGAAEPVPLLWALETPSAQVKSAVLFAGLNTPGRTIVIERLPSRDHTEIMLRHFGAEVSTTDLEDGGREVAVTGQAELDGCEIEVPGDPSAAAFPAVAALLAEGSRITLRGLGVNPLRMGLYRTLQEMGARFTWAGERLSGGEKVADLTVEAGPLGGVEVPADRAPSMIDEYPALAVAAASARGTTTLHGLAELRLKESDRLAAIEQGLNHCGVETESGPDHLVIKGCDGPPPGPEAGAPALDSHLDHRIAMAFAVLGVASRRPVTIDDDRMIATSFPGFAELMNGLGADMGAARKSS